MRPIFFTGDKLFVLFTEILLPKTNNNYENLGANGSQGVFFPESQALLHWCFLADYLFFIFKYQKLILCKYKTG